MCSDAQKIVLCKGQSRENESQKLYQQVLENAGYSCSILPALNFEFVNLNELEQCLMNYEQYSGLILTSQRSIEAIDLAIKNKSISLKNWTNLPTFCVGPATASLARNLLNLQNVQGDETGSAENLGHFIVQNTTNKELPLLYPCSEIAREALGVILKENNIKFKKLIVYQTLPSKTLKSDFDKILNSNVQYLVIFSPSVANCVIPLLYKHNNLKKSIKLIAIGQVTNEALNKLGEKVAAVSSKPEPLALLQAIQSCT